jgi:hypothetical protein
MTGRNGTDVKESEEVPVLEDFFAGDFALDDAGEDGGHDLRASTPSRLLDFAVQGMLFHEGVVLLLFQAP